MATILSVPCTGLPQACSDSPLTHSWERSLFPTLGSTEEERAQKGDEGKTATRTTQTDSARAATPWPRPALLQHSWYSSVLLGINLTPCQRRTPADAEYRVKSGKPDYTQPFFSLHQLVRELHVIFFLTPKDDSVSRIIQLHSLSKRAGARTRGYTHPLNARSVLLPAK